MVNVAIAVIFLIYLSIQLLLKCEHSDLSSLRPWHYLTTNEVFPVLLMLHAVDNDNTDGADSMKQTTDK